MDKSLKQLNRLELLELMVKLSEENDVISAENAQLKQALSAKPAMSRAAKVGSIAELALQANGFFEAAQHAADDYLREIKRMHDQVAARAAASGQAPATGNARVSQTQVPMVQAGGASVPGTAQPQAQPQAQAQAQAQAILARANSQAEMIIADARSKAETMLTDASRQSRSIISRANHQADAVIQAARSDAAQQSATRPDAQRLSASRAATDGATANSAMTSNAAPSRGRHARPAEGAR